MQFLYKNFFAKFIMLWIFRWIKIQKNDIFAIFLWFLSDCKIDQKLIKKSYQFLISKMYSFDDQKLTYVNHKMDVVYNINFDT